MNISDEFQSRSRTGEASPARRPNDLMTERFKICGVPDRYGVYRGQTSRTTPRPLGVGTGGRLVLRAIRAIKQP